MARKVAQQELLDALGPIHRQLGERQSQQIEGAAPQNTYSSGADLPFEPPFMEGWEGAGAWGRRMTGMKAQLFFDAEDIPGRSAILQLAVRSNQPGSQLMVCSGGRVIGSGVVARTPVLITAPLPEWGADTGVLVDLLCLSPAHAHRPRTDSAATLLNWNLTLPPQLIDSRIEFGSKSVEPLLRDGWYAEDDGWGRWTSGRRAVVAVPIPLDFAGGSLALTMSFVPNAMTGRTALRLGGREIGWAPASGGDVSAVIHETLLCPGEMLEIEVCCDGMRLPSQEPGSADQRTLGVGVAWMSLASVGTGKTTQAQSWAHRARRRLRRLLNAG
jgi:hypothetical protein